GLRSVSVLPYVRSDTTTSQKYPPPATGMNVGSYVELASLPFKIPVRFVASSGICVAPSMLVSHTSLCAPRENDCVERSNAIHFESGANVGYVTVGLAGSFTTICCVPENDALGASTVVIQSVEW